MFIQQMVEFKSDSEPFWTIQLTWKSNHCTNSPISVHQSILFSNTSWGVLLSMGVILLYSWQLSIPMEGDQRTAKSSFWHHPLVVHPSILKGFQVLQNDCKTCDPSGLQGTIQHQHDYYWFLRQGEIWMTRLITWEWLSEGWELWQREWEWR